MMVAVPRAPNLRPARSPIFDIAMLEFELPEASIENGDCMCDGRVEYANAPRGPTLHPETDPVFDIEMPDLELPAAFTEDDELFFDTGTCVFANSVPRAPKLRPASSPVFDAAMTEFNLPEAFTIQDEPNEAGDSGESKSAVGLDFDAYYSDSSDELDSDEDSHRPGTHPRSVSNASTAIGGNSSTCASPDCGESPRSKQSAKVSEYEFMAAWAMRMNASAFEIRSLA
jgi:hypothetical protein